MAVFVDLDDDEESPTLQQQHGYNHATHGKPEWNGHHSARQAAAAGSEHGHAEAEQNELSSSIGNDSTPGQNIFRNAMTEALGCYPVAMAVASSLDLISLDNLSRTCRQIHVSLLQYRSPLKLHSLHCINEDVALDPDDTLRYRARAGNWFYMEDVGRSGGNYNGKSGQSKESGSASLVEGALEEQIMTISRTNPHIPDPYSLLSLRRKLLTTGRRIWRWRNQYGDIIGGLGTGIGDGDRGVICGRDSECCASKEREHETDCDAADAREHVISNPGTPPPANPHPFQSWMTSNSAYSPTPSPSSSPDSRRTPSPSHLGPGYSRHEIEGIGGVVKTKKLSMIRVGACVPEWEDERSKGEILGREVSGCARSWCGWCWRVIPGKKDFEKGAQAKGSSSLPTVKADA
ncbi:hypothetical protein SCUP234_00282 [Seiridium cupressi]